MKSKRNFYKNLLECNPLRGEKSLISRIRWVECQLDSISKLRSDADRRDALNHLLDGLPQTYKRMLDAIARIAGDKEIVIKVMTWLIYASRPLRIQDLVLVAALKPGKAFHFDQQLDPDDILEICGSFLKVSDTVNFARFSVAEYFTTSTLPDGTTNPYFIGQADGHRLLTLCCLTYLSSPPFDEGPSSNELETFTRFKIPFLDYAAFKWPAHAKLVETDVCVHQSIYSFLVSLAHESWAEFLAYFDDPYDWQGWIRTETSDNLLRCRWKPNNPLYTSALFGFNNVLQDILRNRRDVNALGGKYRYPLGAAIEAENLEAVQLLINASADLTVSIPTSCPVESTPLHVAAMYRNKELIKMLLDAGADIHRKDLRGCFPLYYLFLRPLSSQTKTSDPELVTLLMDDHIMKDPNESDRVLFQACNSGHIEGVQILLGAGAKVSGKDCQGNTLMHYAARCQDLELVKTLIDKRVDTSTRNNRGWQPIHTAVVYGRSEGVFNHLLKIMYPQTTISMTISVRSAPLPVYVAGSLYGAYEPAFWKEAEIWLERLKELVNLDPCCPITCNMLGDCYLKSGNEKLALECFDEALSRDPANDNINRICDIVHPVFCGDRCFRNGPQHGRRKRIRGLRYKCPQCPPVINGCDRRFRKSSWPCGDICSDENLDKSRLHSKSYLIMIPSESWLRSKKIDYCKL